MSGSFIGDIQRFVGTHAPWFLRNPNVGRFLEAAALALDSVSETLAQGIALAHPLRCDASALPVIARDRGLRLYASEPIASQRYRLSRWWQLHRQFGTHVGQMRNVQPFFLSHAALPKMRIVHTNGTSATWHTLDADGTYTRHRATPSNWDWDGLPPEDGWSRYWLIIYTDQLGLPAQPEWDEGQEWDGGSIWDGLLTAAQIDDIVGGVLEARGRHTKLWGVIFAPNPAHFDPTATAELAPEGWSNLPMGNWGFSIDNGNGKPTRGPARGHLGASFAYDLGSGV